MSFRYATKGNGTSTYGTVPAWTATNWEVEFDVVFPTTLTTADSAVYLDSNVSSNRIYFYTVATVARMDYPPGTSLLMDGVPVARNTTQHPTDGLAHHMKLTGTILGGIGTILRRYITPNFAPGALFNLSLKDLDNPVTNSRFYPMDEDATSNVFVDTLNGQNGTWYSRTSANLIYLDTGTPNTDLAVIDSYLSLDATQYAQAPIGATRLATRGNTAALSYGRIPVWTATNWEVEFDVLFAATATGDRYFIDTDASGGSRLALYTNTTGKLQWSTYAGVTVYLDNVLIANNTVSHPVDGVLRKLRIVGTNQTMQFGTILSRFSITQTSESVIFNLRLTDLDTPANSRFYPMDETIATSTFLDTSANAAHGTWYNRTAGDVITVYPGAIKPGQEFWVACKFRSPPVASSNWILSLGSYITGSSSFGLRIFNPLTDAQLNFYRYNGTTITGTVLRPGALSLDEAHTVIIKVTSAGAITIYLNSLSDVSNVTLPALFAATLNRINLNGLQTTDGVSISRGTPDIFYAYIYNGSPSNADINALMAGENPAYVGDILQGYSLAGDGDEINGGPALTLYGAFDGNEWFVPSTGRIRKVVSSPVRSLVSSIVRSPVN